MLNYLMMKKSKKERKKMGRNNRRKETRHCLMQINPQTLKTKFQVTKQRVEGDGSRELGER